MISFRYITYCCLCAWREASYEGCHGLEGSPCAGEIIGIEGSVDGGGWMVVVRKGQVLNEAVFTRFSGFRDKGQGRRLERADFVL